jgi:hypothetical protein
VTSKEKNNRISKTLKQKLLDLDAHLFLLRTHLHKLKDNRSHIKVIAAELRTLICYSGKTEGLLWRLTDELKIDDRIKLHLPGKVNYENPLMQGLDFLILPLKRADKGAPQIKAKRHSLRGIIKQSEAIVAIGKSITHEYIIKAVAQQIGTSHEDDGVEPALDSLAKISIDGVEPYINVLAFDAEMTLEVGERVLRAAEAKSLISRPVHNYNYGNLSIVLRFQKDCKLSSKLEILRLRSFISSIEIKSFATNDDVIFTAAKDKEQALSLSAPYQNKDKSAQDVVVAFSYCSHARKARILSSTGADEIIECNLNWAHAPELTPEYINNTSTESHKLCSFYIFERLVSTKDIMEIAQLPSDGYGIWKYSNEIEAAGPFPK